MPDKKKSTWKRLRRNLSYLLHEDLYAREQEYVFRLKDAAVEDALYEFDLSREYLPHLTVLDAEETVRLLAEHPKSLARFGDGEIDIIEGRDGKFQTYDPALAAKLDAILRTKRDDLYVALNRAYFQSPYAFVERSRRFYRLNSTYFRRFFFDHCDRDNTYLDATFCLTYYRYDDDFDYESTYARTRALFAGKNLAVVCGEGVLDKLTYDVFEDAASKVVLTAPARNAFAQYDEILERIRREVPKDTLVCLILGMTATALAADLAAEGYTAWDVGHMAKDYDAYRRGLEKTDANITAFWAPD